MNGIKSSTVLLVSAIGICIGITATSLWGGLIFMYVLILVIGFVVLYARILFSVSRYAVIGAVFCIGCALGGLRMLYVLHMDNSLSVFEIQHIEMQAVVTRDSSVSQYYTNIIVEPLEIYKEPVVSHSYVLLRAPLDTEVRVGDVVTVSGVLEVPETFINESGIEFNYVSFLRAKHISHIVPKASISSTGEHQPGLLRELSFVRSSFIETISSVFSFPHSALLSGLLIGGKESLGETYLTEFIRAGVSHIIVLSGFNIAIVALAIMALTSFLPRVVGIVLAGVSVVCFALLVGAEPTVVRATCMVLIALSGRLLGRSYDALYALLIAGVGMLLFNPFLLLYDVSFELSFMATLSLVIVSPNIEHFFAWIPKIAGLREIVVSTVAVELLVTPIIMYRIGSVSVVGLLSNMLILPVISPTMLFGFISIVLGYVSHTLAVIAGYPAYLLLEYELWVVEKLSHLSFALVEMPARSLWFIAIWYGACGVCLYVLYTRCRETDDENKITKNSS